MIEIYNRTFLVVASIWETLEGWAGSFRDWIHRNYANPILWVGIIVVAFLVFRSVYSTLNRGGE